MNTWTAWRVLAGILVLLTAVAAEEPGDLATEDLLELEIDALLDVDVSSVARKQQKLSEVAAALTVLTPEEIGRSGHVHLAEMLRLVPGFHVARLDANKWSVSSRGFGGRFTDKLLVMIDGRSVYTPTFAGVYWDIQQVFLPDLDRIEVIRGPGATVWGANAVNGVVNVNTKSAKDTLGAVFELGFGVEETVRVGGRVGWEVDEDTWARVYASGVVHDDFKVPMTGGDAADDWHLLKVGFRVDGDRPNDTTWALQGELYRGKSGERLALPSLTAPPGLVTADEETAGGHMLVRWRRDYGDDSEIEVQAYFDRTERPTVTLGEERSTFDLDFRHRFRWRKKHDVVWGAGYRVTADSFDNSFAISMMDRSRTDHLFSAFIQDEITIIEDRLIVTFGTKLEHNDYSGFEVQPSARVAWYPKRLHTAWAAVSRAVRTPSRADHDIRINTAVLPGPTTVAFIGNDSLDAEELISFEAGYRFSPAPRVTVEVAGFYNVYDKLRTLTNGAPFLEGPGAVAPSFFTNDMHGEVYGGEIAVTWRVLNRWRLIAQYSYTRMSLHTSTDRVPVDGEASEGRYPRNMASVRSQFDLNDAWQFDAGIYYVDVLPDFGIASYIRFDVRVAYRPSDALLVELIVQNILDNSHPEGAEELPFLLSSEVETAALLRITYSW